jgi:hypothetical protein
MRNKTNQEEEIVHISNYQMLTTKKSEKLLSLNGAKKKACAYVCQ